MTQYISANVNLTDNQIQKLRQSINANCAATSIKIGANDLDGDHTIFLTKAQINKLENARGRGKGLTIRMSSKQLKHNIKTQGGFLGALIGTAARAVWSRVVRFSKESFTILSKWRPFWVSIHRNK